MSNTWTSHQDSPVPRVDAIRLYKAVSNTLPGPPPPSGGWLALALAAGVCCLLSIVALSTIVETAYRSCPEHQFVDRVQRSVGHG